MEHKLYAVDDVVKMIEKGDLLALAGDERILSRLPKGNWIAGTIPYFMDKDRGKFDTEHIFVNKLADASDSFRIRSFNETGVENFLDDAFDNGFSFIIIPAFSQVHKEYALKANYLPRLYDNPVVGWVSGVDLNSTDTPKTFNGNEGKAHEDHAVVVHVQLPPEKIAQVEIVNIFSPDENSPEIEFFTDSFEVINCLIDGEEKNFAQFLKENNVDTKLPIIADYTGAHINVSIREVDDELEMVSFYAPVFAGKTYRLSKPVGNYVKKFEVQTLNLGDEDTFTCNCVLNYLYGELENKKIPHVTGPVTFGEIAYKLLNQTLVRLSIVDLNQ